MQFNVTNGPVSTWRQFVTRTASRRGPAPTPPTRRHPSVYERYDAIMAAATPAGQRATTVLDDAAPGAPPTCTYGPVTFGPATSASPTPTRSSRALNWSARLCPALPRARGLIAAVHKAWGRKARRQALYAQAKHA